MNPKYYCIPAGIMCALGTKLFGMSKPDIDKLEVFAVGDSMHNELGSFSVQYRKSGLRIVSDTFTRTASPYYVNVNRNYEGDPHKILIVESRFVNTFHCDVTKLGTKIPGLEFTSSGTPTHEAYYTIYKRIKDPPAYSLCNSDNTELARFNYLVVNTSKIIDISTLQTKHCQTSFETYNSASNERHSFKVVEVDRLDRGGTHVATLVDRLSAANSIAGGVSLEYLVRANDWCAKAFRTFVHGFVTKNITKTKDGGTLSE